MTIQQEQKPRYYSPKYLGFKILLESLVYSRIVLTSYSSLTTPYTPLYDTTRLYISLPTQKHAPAFQFESWKVEGGLLSLDEEGLPGPVSTDSTATMGMKMKTFNNSLTESITSKQLFSKSTLMYINCLSLAPS